MKEQERFKNFINCSNMTIQATCTSKNLQWSRWIDEYAVKDFENVCFKNKLLSKSLTIKAYNLQKCHCSFFLVPQILLKTYPCLWEWDSETVFSEAVTAADLKRSLCHKKFYNPLCMCNSWGQEWSASGFLFWLCGPCAHGGTELVLLTRLRVAWQDTVAA